MVQALGFIVLRFFFGYWLSRQTNEGPRSAVFNENKLQDMSQ